MHHRHFHCLITVDDGTGNAKLKRIVEASGQYGAVRSRPAARNSDVDGGLGARVPSTKSQVGTSVAIGAWQEPNDHLLRDATVEVNNRTQPGGGRSFRRPLAVWRHGVRGMPSPAPKVGQTLPKPSVEINTRSLFQDFIGLNGELDRLDQAGSPRWAAKYQGCHAEIFFPQLSVRGFAVNTGDNGKIERADYVASRPAPVAVVGYHASGRMNLD